MHNIRYYLFPTKKIQKLIFQNSTGLSLDAGCGEGIYFNSFKNQVIGIDITLELLKKAKNKCNEKINLVLGDTIFLPFKDKVFDFILCSNVMEHIQDNEVKKAIHEFERVSKGVIQIDVPNSAFLPELLRRILFRESCKVINTHNKSPLYHHSIWTVQKLKNMGFFVRGCLGWVTRERIKFSFICDVYDIFTWNIPWIAGTIIGIKYIKTINNRNRDLDG